MSALVALMTLLLPSCVAQMCGFVGARWTCVAVVGLAVVFSLFAVALPGLGGLLQLVLVGSFLPCGGVFPQPLWVFVFSLFQMGRFRPWFRLYFWLREAVGFVCFHLAPGFRRGGASPGRLRASEESLYLRWLCATCRSSHSCRGPMKVARPPPRSPPTYEVTVGRRRSCVQFARMGASHRARGW